MLSAAFSNANIEKFHCNAGNKSLTMDDFASKVIGKRSLVLSLKVIVFNTI